MKSILRTIRKYSNLQSLIIHRYKWKYLIILDCCRYDYFIKNWKYNKVYEVISPASTTVQWLKWTFPDYYDYSIFSCNPYIGNKKYKKWSYNVYEHFKNVICLWYDQWDERYSTVLPETVYKYCIRNAVPRSIIWFLQPHSPYIDLEVKKTTDDFVNWNPKFNPIDWSEDNYIDKYTIEQIKGFYENNLKYVIPYVLKLIEILEKPIIITSDHGELLGEYGLIGHPNIKKKELRNVPMVIIR